MRDVLVVGGGPVGLALAARLADAGLDVAVWERREGVAQTSRAIGLHAPALEWLDDAGLAGTIVDEAVHVRRGVARTRDRVLGTVDFGKVSERFGWVGVLPQARTESLLALALAARAPEALSRGTSLVSLHEERDHVRAVGSRDTGSGPDGSRRSVPVEESARFVVGADGARSTVRHLVGIEAPVRTYPDTYVMADLADTTGAGDDAVIHLETEGVVESFPLPGGLRRWVVRTPALVPAPDAATLCTTVEHRTGLALDPGTATMVSAFEVRRRVASALVRGRVVLAGDAAHEISPIGGQGMNLGWLDAAHLAPVLVHACRTGAPARAALDRYDAVRRRRAWWSARQAEANMALGRPCAGASRWVRDTALAATLATPAARGLASVYAMRPLRSPVGDRTG